MKTTDLKDYSVYQWGKNTTKSLYFIGDNQAPEVGTQQTIAADETKTTFVGSLYTPQVTKTSDNILSGVEVKYFSVGFTPHLKVINNFYNQFVSSVAGETVYLGGGVPIAYNQEEKMKAQVTFKAVDSDGNPVTSEQVHYVFSDKQFKDGAVDTTHSAKNLGSGTIAVNSSVTVELDGKGYLWVNIYANTPLYDVAIDTITLSKE